MWDQMVMHRSCSFLHRSPERTSFCRIFRHTDFAFRWYWISLAEVFGSMHAYIHPQYHLLQNLNFVALSYFVPFLLAREFGSWCCWNGFMWRGLCCDIWKSLVYSPTSAWPAKECCSHREACSLCLSLLSPTGIVLSIYLPTHLPFPDLFMNTHLSISGVF